MLIDPLMNLTVPVDERTRCAYEVCDPVQGSELEIDGLRLTSFVYPSWFEASRPPGGHEFDLVGQVTKPFQVLPHGYMPIFRGGQWSQVFGPPPAHARSLRRDHRGLRRARRGRVPRPSER